jgi:CheY-like chemotaxis protein
MLLKGPGLTQVNGNPFGPERLVPSDEVLAVRMGVDARKWKPLGSRLLRVLIADSDRDAADSLSILAKLWGHDVRHTYDGRAALETAFAYEPDILISDIAMPEMDGFWLARQLRSQIRFKNTLLIALSGYVDEANRRRAKKAGFHIYLRKPVDPSILETLLWLERGRLQRSSGEAN